MGLGAALGYMAGGALEGYGKGIVDDARALRDARLQELADQRRNDFQMQRDEREMSFRREEGRLDREMRLSEGEANRRAQGRQYVTSDDGTTTMLEDGKAKPVTSEDGQPFRSQPKGASAEKFSEIMTKRLADTAPEFGGETPEEYDQRYERVRRKVLEELSTSTVPRQKENAKGAGALPPGVSADQLIAAAQAAIKNGKDPAAVEAKLREYGLSLQSSGGSDRRSSVDEPRQSRESMGGPARYKPGGEITAGMDPRVATSQYKKNWADSIEERRKRHEEQK